jgi:hypothetical protein
MNIVLALACSAWDVHTTTAAPTAHSRQAFPLFVMAAKTLGREPDVKDVKANDEDTSFILPRSPLASSGTRRYCDPSASDDTSSSPSGVLLVSPSSGALPVSLLASSGFPFVSPSSGILCITPAADAARPVPPSEVGGFGLTAAGPSGQSPAGKAVGRCLKRKAEAQEQRKDGHHNEDYQLQRACKLQRFRKNAKGLKKLKFVTLPAAAGGRRSQMSISPHIFNFPFVPCSEGAPQGGGRSPRSSILDSFKGGLPGAPVIAPALIYMSTNSVDMSVYLFDGAGAGSDSGSSSCKGRRLAYAMFKMELTPSRTS